MSDLFDYSDKSTDWIERLLAQYRAAVISAPNAALYKLIVASAEAALRAKGVSV